MKSIFLCLALITVIACKPKDTAVAETSQPKPDTIAVDNTNEVPGLKLLWTTEKTLTTAESVLYDRNGDVLYVSCINGVPPDKKDKDGFIAKVGLDGTILTQKWATGLSGPKGMGIYGGMLYVADIDRLVAINLATGKIETTWNVKGAKFLNDVAIADDGAVYFTDSNTSSIYTLRNGQVETMIDADATLGGTNGIYIDGNHLMLAGMNNGNLMRMDLSSHNVEKVAEGIGAGDGIEKYKKGWLASNWNGSVYYIGSDREIMEILNSQEAKLNTADIEVVEDKNLMFVPTFFGNSVTAYELVKQ